MDATWIGCRPAAVARIVGDAANWRRWWPDLDLRVDERRGVKGVRWSVPAGRNGRFAGSMEIWLQAVDGGTVAHFFLRLDGARRPLTPRERGRLAHEHRVRIKQILWAVADRVDPGRLARLAGPPTRIP